MRYLATLTLLFATNLLFCQTRKPIRKVEIYKDEKGRELTKSYVDSLTRYAHHYVAKKKIKETEDVIIYKVIHFDKMLTSSRYKVDGAFCGNSKRMTTKEIKSQFPFNETKSIRLVSFKRPQPDSLELQRQLPMKNGQIDFSRLYEVVTLSDELAEKVMDILVNYKNPVGRDVFFCTYEPRNAILFMDKADKVIGYVEICFDCWDLRIEPKEMLIGEFCMEKFDALQGLFMEVGIKYGMKKHME